MDQHRYEWQSLFAQPPIQWPGGAPVAVWVLVIVEWFELDESLRQVQSLGSPLVGYPDYWGYTRLDYGTRVGLPRIMATLADQDIRATAAVNADVCGRYPALLMRAAECNWEFVGHGRTSSEIIHEQMPAREECELIGESLVTLRASVGKAVRGWLSPSWSESKRTPDLLAAAAIEYVCDWVNDDLPYQLDTCGGRIYALPGTYELSDLHLIHELHQTAAELRDALIEQFETLAAEAAQFGGRCLCIPLHPWLSGVPHRIRYVAEVLDHIARSRKAWFATAGEIIDAVAAARAA